MAELYAIVGSMERARLMLEAGAPYLQLRCKGGEDAPLLPHGKEIAGWKERYPRTHVIVNDDLDLAVSLGVWGVHLGQEDLLRYPAETLRSAPLQVGISTHTDQEIEIALDHGAALLGFGPVFPTATKELKYAPQGIARLQEIVRGASLPIVAIGGIDGGNLGPVSATGVDMIAMISYLDRFQHPEDVQSLMERMRPSLNP